MNSMQYDTMIASELWKQKPLKWWSPNQDWCSLTFFPLCRPVKQGLLTAGILFFCRFCFENLNQVPTNFDTRTWVSAAGVLSYSRGGPGEVKSEYLLVPSFSGLSLKMATLATLAWWRCAFSGVLLVVFGIFKLVYVLYKTETFTERLLQLLKH